MGVVGRWSLLRWLRSPKVVAPSSDDPGHLSDAVCRPRSTYESVPPPETTPRCTVVQRGR